MKDLPAYVVETLWEDEEFILSRRVPDDGQASTLVSAPASAHPTAEAEAQLDHAYALRNELDPAWAARPVALERRRGRSALLMEDPGGDVLARVVGKPWELTQFLRVAIGLATTLGRLHSRGFIHKDIKPSNILVNLDTCDVWLLGFGIASRLPRERQAPEPPEVIAGTLAYIAGRAPQSPRRQTRQDCNRIRVGATVFRDGSGALGRYVLGLSVSPGVRTGTSPGGM